MILQMKIPSKIYDQISLRLALALWKILNKSKARKDCLIIYSFTTYDASRLHQIFEKFIQDSSRMTKSIH